MPTARKAPPSSPFWLSLRAAEIHLLTIPLVRPFRFGMVELHSLTHLLLSCTFTFEHPGQPALTFHTATGENLVPKWFEKNPDTTPLQDIASLQSIIRTTLDLALKLPAQPTAFDFFFHLSESATIALSSAAPLARQLGISLLERAAIEATCQAYHKPFASLIADPARPLGIEPIHNTPATSLFVRHTVGLADDLTQVAPTCQSTGIDSLKIKLSGQPDQDESRLAHLTQHLEQHAHPIRRITLDGNESFTTHSSWHAFLVRLRRLHSLQYVRARLAWVEQPLRRDIALTQDTTPLLDTFAEIPHIIDESDANTGDLDQALSLGYVGTTHKNCKGVFKSIRAARLLSARRSTGKFALLSGEDLTIIAPWSMAQDLAVAAAVGVVDVERNGHHYAAGLSAFPPSVAQAALSTHPDLYHPHPTDHAHLHITNGQLSTSTILAAPFGWAGPNPASLLTQSPQ